MYTNLLDYLDSDINIQEHTQRHISGNKSTLGKSIIFKNKICESKLHRFIQCHL